MPFPATLAAMFSSGYDYARWEHCAACGEPVEVYTTPGKREIAMEPMCSRESLAVRHYEVCKPPNPTPEEQKPQEQAVAPQQIAMYGVNDPNHQLIAVGWDDGVLVCQFKTAKWGYAGVPEAEFVKLKRVPYAYRIFTANIKGKYPATKMELNMAFPQTLEEMTARGYKFKDHAECKGCGDSIEWWETPNGKNIPMNPMERGTSPAVAHWSTCTEQDSFRKRD